MEPTLRRDIKLAFIGGSGLYRLNGIENVEHINLKTPFGYPSDAITVCTIGDNDVAFLPRHGSTHSLLPSEIPYAANVYALKCLGVETIVSISAVGSLRENIHPQHVVVPNQLIDRTKTRESTFFGDGVVAHVSFSDPYCRFLSKTLIDLCELQGISVHPNGTYVVIEGPQFSTKAESALYRNWGADIIGMTALPEAKLAREAEICYATLAMVTDFDCWHEDKIPVTADMVLGNLKNNSEMSNILVKKMANSFVNPRSCNCADSLKHAMINDLTTISDESKETFGPLLEKYLR